MRPCRTLVAVAAVASLAPVLTGCQGGGGSKVATSTSAPTSEAPSTVATGPTTSTSVPTSEATSTVATGLTTSTPSTTPPGSNITTSTAGPGAPVLLAAGDIASCSSAGDEATAALLAARPGATVATLGDNVYEQGSPDEFTRCYQPSWGASAPRTKPSVGNHDYATAGAAGYFGYFGPAAGDPARGYYSYELGAWHVVALNSNCSIVSCSTGSAQERWLRDDLAAHPGGCTLAYWHHPRFSSGTTHGSSSAVGPLWQALYDGRADLILQGHEHNYERFAPLDPSGRSDPDRGLRSFVVGTGGRSHYPLGRPLPGSEAGNGDTYGVLQLTLRPSGVDWQFLAVAGGRFGDTGSADCR